MATAELKSILHQHIDRLNDPEDVQDLLLTVTEFISQRTNLFVETPELLAQLEQSSGTAKAGNTTSHDEIIREAKQWITK